ncbi:MAG: hypothetical protein AB7T09_19945 [Planctomycetota bacterium]
MRPLLLLLLSLWASLLLSRPALAQQPPQQPAAAAWQVPALFRDRGDRELFRRNGGSPDAAAALDKALTWLASTQSKDGRWDACGWQKTIGMGAAQHARDRGDARYDVGLSALALLAFLADGETPARGRHKDAVAEGLAWLVAQQGPAGCIGFKHGEEVYNHALATLALVEAYALTGDAKLAKAAQAALDWCVKAQNPRLGWQYGVKTGRNDTSVTCWMLQALLIGKEAGLEAPGDAVMGGRSWLERVTAANGEVGYMTPGGGSSFMPQNDGKYDVLPVMSAASLAVRLRLGDTAKELAKTLRLVSAEPPAWGNGRKVSFYYWYQGTLALRQVGGEAWDAWSEALERALIAHQEGKGTLAGSWPPDGEWCLAGGRVYATAINALSLSVYTRYR